MRRRYGVSGVSIRGVRGRLSGVPIRGARGAHAASTADRAMASVVRAARSHKAKRLGACPLSRPPTSYPHVFDTPSLTTDVAAAAR